MAKHVVLKAAEVQIPLELGRDCSARVAGCGHGAISATPPCP